MEKSFGEKIKEALDYRRIKQEAAASILGMTRQNLSRIINNRNINPREDIVDKLEEYLNWDFTIHKPKQGHEDYTIESKFNEPAEGYTGDNYNITFNLTLDREVIINKSVIAGLKQFLYNYASTR